MSFLPSRFIISTSLLKGAISSAYARSPIVRNNFFEHVIISPTASFNTWLNCVGENASPCLQYCSIAPSRAVVLYLLSSSAFDLSFNEIYFSFGIGFVEHLYQLSFLTSLLPHRPDLIRGRSYKPLWSFLSILRA